MTLLVRDEEDTIAANLEYHLAIGVDFFIVTDNLSTDRTRALLERYREEGLVHLIDEPRDDYSQSAWVTRMARLAATRYEADWVLNSDADEFWWPAGDLREILDRQDPDVGSLTVERMNFAPIIGATGPFFETMTLRERSSTNALGGPLPPKALHRADPGVVVHPGNHSVDLSRGGTTRSSSELVIFHYPLRSYEQFERKIRTGGAAYERNRDLPPSVGATWRWLHDELLAGRLRDRFEEKAVSRRDAASFAVPDGFVKDPRLQQFFRSHPERLERVLSR